VVKYIINVLMLLIKIKSENLTSIRDAERRMRNKGPSPIVCCRREISDRLFMKTDIFERCE